MSRTSPPLRSAHRPGCWNRIELDRALPFKCSKLSALYIIHVMQSIWHTLLEAHRCCWAQLTVEFDMMKVKAYSVAAGGIDHRACRVPQRTWRTSYYNRRYVPCRMCMLNPWKLSTSLPAHATNVRCCRAGRCSAACAMFRLRPGIVLINGLHKFLVSRCASIALLQGFTMVGPYCTSLWLLCGWRHKSRPLMSEYTGRFDVG